MERPRWPHNSIPSFRIRFITRLEFINKFIDIYKIDAITLKGLVLNLFNIR